MSTKEDVLKKFGEPDEIKEADLIDKKLVAYIYGNREEANDYQTKGKFMNIIFNDEDIVEPTVINFVK